MPSRKADLITHPLRARILGALMGRQLTVGQIAQILPDIPVPSLYRHIRALTDGGVLEAISEVRVNGALTKVYATRKDQTVVETADMADATTADHLRSVTTFLNTLAEIFRNYLENETIVPGETPHHAMMGSLHLSKDEYQQFQKELNELVQRWCGREPGGERHRLIFAHLMLPDREDPPLE